MRDTMRSLGVLILTLFALTTNGRPTRRHEPKPVCIIGAGPAGLSAAGRLEDKGIKAMIFDSQEEVGGKCQAWYDNEYVPPQHVGSATDAADHPLSGVFHPLGAAFLSNASYPETLKILNQTTVTTESFALAGAREMFRYNYTNGLIEANPPIAPQFFAAVSSEIPRYVQVWNQRFRNISTTNYKVRQLCHDAQAC
jgi:monoamine oxidase